MGLEGSNSPHHTPPPKLKKTESIFSVVQLQGKCCSATGKENRIRDLMKEVAIRSPPHEPLVIGMCQAWQKETQQLY